MRTKNEIRKELKKYTEINPERLILLPAKEMAAIRASIIALKWVLKEN